ncbi:RTC4-like domain-containing protein isoform 2 [Colletotrichum scovillei]|nr:RTC4-like domain-containing protein isoform 2 [Colletotrichum scovillei]
MGKPKDYFEIARSRHGDAKPDIINGNWVPPRVAAKTRRDYERALGLWYQYSSDVKETADISNVEDLKDFMLQLGRGMNGLYLDTPDPSSLLHRWKLFSAAFCRTELPEELKCRQSQPPRPRRQATNTHFGNLAMSHWKYDYTLYSQPSFRIDFWAYTQLHTFTSARVSDYSESSARAGSRVGLYFKDVRFGLFRNEEGDAEFAMESQKQLKGKQWDPRKRCQDEGEGAPLE